MASVVGEQAASNILTLQSRRKPPTRNHQVEGLDRLWLNLEKQLARIPLDKDGSTLRDEDEVQISQQLLVTDDAPFDYCLKGFYDADEFPKWVSRRQSIQTRANSLRTLFRKWVEAFPLSETEHWSRLPMMFRYALKRPLMPERDLENELKELGFLFPSPYSRTMRAKSEKGREQKLLLGIDIDGSESHQPKAQYDDLIGNGWLSPDQSIEGPETRITDDTGPGSDQDGDREAQTEGELHWQLQATYALFQKGTSDTGEAIARYKHFLGVRDISNSDLALRLEAFGIPKEHIMGPKTGLDQAALHESLRHTYRLLRDGQMSLESAITWYRYLLDQPTEPLPELAARLEDFGLPREHILGRVCKEYSSSPQSPAELEIIEEVKNIVIAYRSGSFKLDEAVSFASERLEGLRIDQKYFSWLISNENLTPTQASQSIFERAAEEPRSPNSFRETDPDEIEALESMAEEFIELYAERIANGLDPGIALAEYRDQYDLDDFEPHEVSFVLAKLQGPDDSVQEVSGMTTTSETDSALDENSGLFGSSMPPPKMRVSRGRSRSLGSETRVRSETPGPDDRSIATFCYDTTTQEPNVAVAEWEDGFSGTAGNPEHRDYDLLRASPEHGISTDLWGLELPTATAKKLALNIGLPTDYVNRRIRSLTPVRINLTKARKLGSCVKFSPTKRKASVTVHQGRRTRSPRSTIDPPVFTKEVGTYDSSVQKSHAPGASMSCATEQSSSDSGSITNSIEELGYESQYQDAHAIDEQSEMRGAPGTADESEMEMKRFTSLPIDGNQHPLEEPDTILKFLETNVLEKGIFRVDLPSDSKSYKAAIRTIASDKKAEIAAKIKWGSLRPIQSYTERRLIILLRDIERDPDSLNVSSLTAFIQEGLRELAELNDVGVLLADELSAKAGQGTPTSLSSPTSSASSDAEVDTSLIFKGILATNTCPHKPSSRQADLYQLYIGKPRLLRDAGFVTQLFVCSECSKSNRNEPLSFIEPMKRPQRLRLTQPKKRPRVISHDDDVPFIRTPKDMSYSAAANCQSFFVGLEMRRLQRWKANLSATNDRYFQNPISTPSSSGSTSQLNKLFEKYKGIPSSTGSIILLG